MHKYKYVSSLLNILQWLAIHTRLKFKLLNMVLYDLVPTRHASIILVTLTIQPHETSLSFLKVSVLLLFYI